MCTNVKKSTLNGIHVSSLFVLLFSFLSCCELIVRNVKGFYMGDVYYVC